MKQNNQDVLLEKIISLCEDIAWGRTVKDDALYDYTVDSNASETLKKLAEIFGFMVVKLGIREEHSLRLIEELTAKNEELEIVKNLVEKRNAKLIKAMQSHKSSDRHIIGQCEPMQQAIKFALSIARRPINTLLLGETGTGKEEFAKLIHFKSSRCEGPFVAVNCSAIPDTLFESELFGIEKGVATGVVQKKGLIEEANKGTLFLDEIADMPFTHQAKLLRVLEEQQLMRVGSSKTIDLDVKVIAAANINLEKAVQDGNFRMDLYYRLNVAEINIPPLRERGDDILLLAQHFLDHHCHKMKLSRLNISRSARSALLAYAWPGNVRELNNEMERAVMLSVGNTINVEDLSPKIITSFKPSKENLEPEPQEITVQETALIQEQNIATSLQSFNLLEIEKHYILNALQETKGNRSRAANLLGITREGLRKKLLRLNITDL